MPIQTTESSKEREVFIPSKAQEQLMMFMQGTVDSDLIKTKLDQNIASETWIGYVANTCFMLTELARTIANTVSSIAFEPVPQSILEQQAKQRFIGIHEWLSVNSDGTLQIQSDAYNPETLNGDIIKGQEYRTRYLRNGVEELMLLRGFVSEILNDGMLQELETQNVTTLMAYRDKYTDKDNARQQANNIQDINHGQYATYHDYQMAIGSMYVLKKRYLDGWYNEAKKFEEEFPGHKSEVFAQTQTPSERVESSFVSAKHSAKHFDDIESFVKQFKQDEIGRLWFNSRLQGMQYPEGIFSQSVECNKSIETSEANLLHNAIKLHFYLVSAFAAISEDVKKLNNDAGYFDELKDRNPERLEQIWQLHKLACALEGISTSTNDSSNQSKYNNYPKMSKYREAANLVRRIIPELVGNLAYSAGDQLNPDVANKIKDMRRKTRPMSHAFARPINTIRQMSAPFKNGLTHKEEMVLTVIEQNNTQKNKTKHLEDKVTISKI